MENIGVTVMFEATKLHHVKTHGYYCWTTAVLKC